MKKKKWYEYKQTKKRHAALLEELKAIAPEEDLWDEIYRVLEERFFCKCFWSVKPTFIYESWNDFKKRKD